ncbi:MAG: hypothetical protein JJE52_01685 [Acidimicrobiia bacterium]|nr:hypothetical protein [Acidimicrobiia bacterium]
MAITEQNRHELYQRLEEILGPDKANTLMEHLPPVGWAQVATKDDLLHLETRLDNKIDRLDTKLTGQIDRLDTKIGGTDTRLTGQIHRLDTKIGSIETRLRSEIVAAESRLMTEIGGVRVDVANLATELHRTIRASAFMVLGAMAALVTLTGSIAALI